MKVLPQSRTGQTQAVPGTAQRAFTVDEDRAHAFRRCGRLRAWTSALDAKSGRGFG